jgi:hypothetical protein
MIFSLMHPNIRVEHVVFIVYLAYFTHRCHLRTDLVVRDPKEIHGGEISLQFNFE